MQRTGSAHWSGGLKDGKGTVSTASGVLKDTQYSFATRFENGVGTNPEELLAAAHAGCFTMALSAQLDGAGMITQVDLVLSAKIPGADKAKFEQAAAAAKAGCPVSKLFNTKITLTTSLA